MNQVIFFDPNPKQIKEGIPLFFSFSAPAEKKKAEILRKPKKKKEPKTTKPTKKKKTADQQELEEFIKSILPEGVTVEFV